MVPEASIQTTENGLAPDGEGWFVLNAREAGWRHWEADQEDFLVISVEALLIVEGHERPHTVDEAARRHGAGVEEETDDAEVAYARFPETEPTTYRHGWLPGT